MRVLGREISRVKPCSRLQQRACIFRRWVQISTTPTGSTQSEFPPSSSTANLNADGPDAEFEVLAAPYSLLAASLSASQPLYARRGTLVAVSGKPDNVISTLSVLGPFRRVAFGIPFLYQKVTSASPIKALISTKSPYTSFTTLYLDGTLDWMISQRGALLAWTGQNLSLKPRIDAKMSVVHWGKTYVTGRGLVGLSGKGQIYQITLSADEKYIVHPSNVLAYTISKNLPLPYRFKSTSLRFEVPGIGGFWRLLPDIKFFRSMRESTGWKFFSTVLFTIRTWSRRTIWGDRLFVQFHGPCTILLQTRASRISDTLTSRDINEIADTEPGALQSAATAQFKTLQDTNPDNRGKAITETTPKVTYASIGKEGNVIFEKQKQ